MVEKTVVPSVSTFTANNGKVYPMWGLTVMRTVKDKESGMESQAFDKFKSIVFTPKKVQFVLDHLESAKGFVATYKALEQEAEAEKVVSSKIAKLISDKKHGIINLDTYRKEMAKLTE